MNFELSDFIGDSKDINCVKIYFSKGDDVGWKSIVFKNQFFNNKLICE